MGYTVTLPGEIQVSMYRGFSLFTFFQRVVVVICVVLSACSSSDSESRQSSDRFFYIGQVKINSQLDSSSIASARFIHVPGGLSLTQIHSMLHKNEAPVNAGCTVVIRQLVDDGINDGFYVETSIIPVETDNFTEMEVSELNAGEVLVLSSDAGTYASLPRVAIDDFVSYQWDFLTNPIPEGLRLSIPGDAFPGFDTLDFPYTTRPEVFSPSGNSITTSTQFSWSIGNDTSGLFLYRGVSNDPLMGLTNENTNVLCAFLMTGLLFFHRLYKMHWVTTTWPKIL